MYLDTVASSTFHLCTGKCSSLSFVRGEGVSFELCSVVCVLLIVSRKVDQVARWYKVSGNQVPVS